MSVIIEKAIKETHDQILRQDGVASVRTIVVFTNHNETIVTSTNVGAHEVMVSGSYTEGQPDA